MRQIIMLLTMVLVISSTVLGCTSEKRTVVRKESVETIPAPAVLEKRTTVEQVVPPPVVEETTTYQRGSVEKRSRTIETTE